MTTDKTITQAEVKRPPAYTVYKPNRNSNGGAMSFHFNKYKQAVFVEAANQSGEKRFDWDNKVIMKWGLTDLGAILGALQNKTPNAKLFHQTEKASSACNLRYQAPDPNNDRALPPFRLIISRQDNQDKSVAKVMISLTEGEAAILETAIRNAITGILEWY